MLVQPPKSISDSLSTKIHEAKITGKVSCLDAPKIAAKHLKTKEDLALFYATSNTAAFTAVFVVTFQAAVAVVATAVAVMAIQGGSSNNSSRELSDLPSEEVFNMNVDDLVKARCMALEAA